MIQRIQTLYLLVAMALIAVCFFIPVAIVSFPTGELFSFNLDGFKLIQGELISNIERTISIFISGLLLCCILLVTIFSYKNRLLQIRLCVYGQVFSAGLAFMLFFVLYRFKKELHADVYYQIGIVFPIIAGILSFLAMKAIRKDDNLVKSYDRLR